MVEPHNQEEDLQEISSQSDDYYNSSGEEGYEDNEFQFQQQNPISIQEAMNLIKQEKQIIAVQRSNLKLEDVYIKQELIGEGAYGKVYKIVHKTTYIVRAVKEIRKRSIREDKQQAREIEALMRLDHPNLVKLIEKFEDSRKMYLVQEFLSGEQLFERLKNKEYLDEEYSRKIFQQILEAINYIHKHNVSHRDIKPENFVFVDNTSDQIKLIDFGLAMHFKIRPSDNKIMNRMQTRVGTAWYTAPEVFKRQYTEKCDIWSAGVMLYVMLSGYPPFFGESETAIRQLILKGEFDFQDEEWNFVSEEVKDLISKMLSPEQSRPSAIQCLEHPWFSAANLSALSMSSKTLFKISEYSSSIKIKQLIHYVIAYRCKIEEEVGKYAKLFKKIDQQKNGYITKEQMIEVLMDKTKDSEISKQMADGIDIDNNNKIYWNEFLSCFIQREVIFNYNNLLEVFDFFDTNKKGYFDTNDVLVALKQISKLTITEDEVPVLIHQAFKGKTKITFADLQNLVFNS